MKSSNTSELLTAYETRKSLLLRLKDGKDEDSWREFYNIYGRMIFGYSLRYGLSHSEAEDVVQDVCVKLFRQILSFDYSPEQGRFRGWLKTVTHNAVIDFIRRKQRRAGHYEEYRLEAEADRQMEDNHDDSHWSAEWEKAMFDAALKRVYERIGEDCRRTFHLYAIENIPALEVGERLGIEANAVYACKHRILRMLREEVERLKDEM
jgi:RNA polymerase sigma-70 factor (ECF subfamily)